MSEILVTGASGLVGSRFAELSKYRDSLILPDERIMDITKSDLDLRNADVVVNFAAYTNVTEGENQRGDKSGLCWQLNVEGVRNLLNNLKPGAFFIQISTDMVFSGTSGPYGETDTPEEDSNKVTWYGYTKAEGERLCKKHTILRLIYPVRAKFDQKLDYLRKPLKLFDEGKLYPIFNDQQISISFIDEIAKALDLIIEKKAKGVFHASSSDLTTPFELISYLIKQARGVDNVVQPSSLAESVRYPKYGGLKVERTEQALGIKFSTWRGIVDKLIVQKISV